MEELFRRAPSWLTDTRLARRAFDTRFRSRARRRIAELDHLVPARSQKRILLGLVHQSHTTRFGQDHDFRRIRTVADFRRTVPLRTPAELWREYWQPAFPHLAGATWPSPVSALAVSANVLIGPFPCLPVSPALLAAHRRAAFTALALVAQARPAARLFAGRLVFLGDGTTLEPAGRNARPAPDLSELTALPPSYVHSTLHGDTPSGTTADEHLHRLASEVSRMPVTCLAGTTERLLHFVAHVKQLTGCTRILDLWPGLSAVVYTRGPLDPDRSHLLAALGMPPLPLLLLEACLQPEGAIAIEDPRSGRLRLLTDHDVFFEFVPMDQLGRPLPDRLGIGEVQPDVPYALAMSSPAGLWACLVGTVVSFERCNPPLLRVVATGIQREQPATVAPPPAKPVRSWTIQPPHPRISTGLTLPVFRSIY